MIVLMNIKIKAKQIFISTDFITLDSFLKLSGAVISGGQAKVEIQSGNVLVNNEVCLMRGKKIRENDTVKFNNMLFEVKNSEKI